MHDFAREEVAPCVMVSGKVIKVQNSHCVNLSKSARADTPPVYKSAQNSRAEALICVKLPSD